MASEPAASTPLSLSLRDLPLAAASLLAASYCLGALAVHEFRIAAGIYDPAVWRAEYLTAGIAFAMAFALVFFGYQAAVESWRKLRADSISEYQETNQEVFAEFRKLHGYFERVERKYARMRSQRTSPTSDLFRIYELLLYKLSADRYAEQKGTTDLKVLRDSVKELMEEQREAYDRYYRARERAPSPLMATWATPLVIALGLFVWALDAWFPAATLSQSRWGAVLACGLFTLPPAALFHLLENAAPTLRRLRDREIPLSSAWRLGLWAWLVVLLLGVAVNLFGRYLFAQIPASLGGGRGIPASLQLEHGSLAGELDGTILDRVSILYLSEHTLYFTRDHRLYQVSRDKVRWIQYL